MRFGEKIRPYNKGMAARKQDTAVECRKICEDAGKGVFAPVYLLMGEEPYYPDMACDAIIKNALQDEERDFNQTIFYGPDVTNIDDVFTAACTYPFMSSRRLVVLKEAQNMAMADSKLDQLAKYCLEPSEGTVLVVLMRGKSADKRKAFYKAVSKKGVVLDSPAIRDYQIASWISDYYRERGLGISPDAAALLGEYAGTDLLLITAETDKMLKNLGEGCKEIKASDIEKNVGISRQFSIFELTKALSAGNKSQCMRIAYHIGNSARFALPAATGPLFNHFHRILRYNLLFEGGARPSPEDKAKALAGVNPYFYKEYDVARANYPLRRCLSVLGTIEEYDYKGKGGDGEATSQSELLLELVTKIIN